MKVIVGLGNPGRRYERTRHNIGFMIVDSVAERNKITVARRMCGALVGEWSDRSERFVLAKPQAYMNRSGGPVKDLLDKFHAGTDDLVVVYDDLDLPFGRIRIRKKGSAGGHRGVASVMEVLAGAQFDRVRVGIGRPPEGVDPVDYVLEPFDAEDRAKLDGVISKAADAVMSLLFEGSERAMEQFNRSS